MQENLTILAVIPARGGSKGILHKNIKQLGGKPLLAYTAEAALNSKKLNRVILSTEDNEIIQVGLDLALDVPFIRPAELAQDNTPGLPVIQHAVRTLGDEENYRPDIIVVLQPTSPLRTAQHIDEALEVFMNGDADSLVSVTEVPHNMNPYSVMQTQEDGTIVPFLDYDERKNLRQQKPRFYARNGAAIYICTYECLMEKNSMYGDKILPYFMKKGESFDLDDEIDWSIIDYIMSKS
jgi:CMP-N-acetylneuraminic acid synthetase